MLEFGDRRAEGGRSLLLKNGEINLPALHLFERDARRLVVGHVHLDARARATLKLFAALRCHEYEAVLRVNRPGLALLRVLLVCLYRVGGFCHISPMPAFVSAGLLVDEFGDPIIT